MSVLHIDFETRSTIDLKAEGLHRYAIHPSTDVWCLGDAFDDEVPEVWTPGQPCPERIRQHVEAGGTVVAHNAPFELAIWNEIMAPRYGWPKLKPEQTYCTMAQAYAMGLPGALEDAALALGLNVRKDAEGRALMLRMARPRRYDGDKPIWWDDPDKVARLQTYCRQDVVVERELHRRLVPLSEYERRVWLMDYDINSRGVQVDIPSALAAIDVAEQEKADADEELAHITDGAVQKHTAIAAMKKWITDQGVTVGGLAKQDIADLLAGDLPADVRRVLEIRQSAGKSSVAKLETMVNIASPDSRVRNILQYHGAATGRWAGRKLQPHNFVRDVPSQAEVAEIMALLQSGDINAIRMMYGPPMEVISRCLRGFFVPAPGKVFVSGDFSNVEGRGVAWISGEEWKLSAFRECDADPELPDMYERAYAKSFNIRAEDVTDKQRQIGKVQELAFGFGGGVGAFHSMAKNYGVKVSDAEADEFKTAWRAAHPMTKRTWRDLEDAAKSAVRCPGEVFSAGAAGRQVRFKIVGSFLWCRLPGGRCLAYAYPKLLEGRYGPQLTYMTVPSADDLSKGRLISDPANGPKWARVSTYGGSLMENIVQALCRDLLVDCMIQMDVVSRIVLHVHDEIVIEVPKDLAALARAFTARTMTSPPAWADGFPLTAKPAIMGRYGK